VTRVRSANAAVVVVALFTAVAGWGCLGLDDLRSGTLYLGYGSKVSFIPADNGCAPMDERVQVAWNGLQLPRQEGGGRTKQVQGIGQATPHPVCVGYIWENRNDLRPAAPLDVVEFSDGRSTLKVEIPAPSGRIDTFSPADRILSSQDAWLDFTASGLHLQWVRCEGPWSKSNVPLPLVAPLNPLPGRQRLRLNTTAEPPVPVGHYRCTPLDNGYLLEATACPAKACVVRRTGEVFDADTPDAVLTFDLDVQ